MAFARVKLSDQLPPPLATVFENSSGDSAGDDPFHFERPLRRKVWAKPSPLGTVPPLLSAPPDRPLPRVPRPHNPHARPRPHLAKPAPTSPPKPQPRPKAVPNFSRPLPPKPLPRDRDYSDAFVAWTRYIDKTEPLSQSGALRAYHQDMLTRPPGYNPEHEDGCLESTKEWFATLYWRWQRLKASGSNSRQVKVGQRQGGVARTRCDTPWEQPSQNQQSAFWL